MTRLLALALALVLQLSAAHSEEPPRIPVAEMLCDGMRVDTFHYGNPRVLVLEIVDPVERARFARQFENIGGWYYLNGKRCVVLRRR